MSNINISISYSLLREAIKIVLINEPDRSTFYRWVQLAAPNKPYRCQSLEFSEYQRFVTILRYKKTVARTTATGGVTYNTMTYQQVEQWLTAYGEEKYCIELLYKTAVSSDGGMSGRFFMDLCRAKWGAINQTNFYSWARRNGIKFNVKMTLTKTEVEMLFDIIQKSMENVTPNEC